MNGLSKALIKIGVRPVSVLLLIVTLLLMIVVATVFGAKPENQDKNDAAMPQAMLATIDNAIADKQRQLSSIVKSSSLIQAVANDSAADIERWQTNATQLLPDVKQVCVLLQAVTSPVSTGCLPISFATLNSLRQLQETPQADVAMLQMGSDQAHILFAQKLGLATHPNATVLMALKPVWVDDLVTDSLAKGGYAEITQGKDGGTVLTRFGNPQYKTAAASFTRSIADSHWTLRYWMQPAADEATGTGLMTVLLVLIVLVFWLLRDRWFSKQLNRDAKTLHEQLFDLQQEKLKPNYLLALKPLRDVCDHIQQLVLPKKTSPAKSQALQIEDVTPQPEPVAEPSAEAELIVEQALNSVSDTIKKDDKPLQLDPEQQDDSPLELTPDGDANDLTTDEPQETKDELPLEFNLEQVAHETPLDLTTTTENTESASDGLPDEAIFRAYDVRGVVDKQLTKDVMHQLGQAVGSEALEQGQLKLVVGRDGRLSSESLAEAFMGGVLSTGCDVVVLGEVPTPMVYFACEQLKTYTGAMITGSHNPTNFNGLKVVIAGKTLLGKSVYRLYERIKDKNLKQGQGQRSKHDISEAYIERIKGDIQLKRGMRVVVDCGNGVAGHIAGSLLRAIGCDVTELYCEVDGNFPNHHPDPGQPKNLQDLIKEVQSQRAELGLAFDGDGDRLGVVDAKGNIIWPDRLLLFIAQHLLATQPGATIIYDVKSTNLLAETITRAGGRPVMSPSGHSVIKNMMAEENAILAGEMTGHLFFKDRWYGFDDALYSAGRLLELLAADQQERSPTEIFAALPQRVSTPEIIIKMKEGESVRFIDQLQANVDFAGGKLSTIDGVRVDYPNGWGLVRASNTVPGLTLRFEASSDEELEQIKQAFIQQMLQIKPTLSLSF